MLKIPYTHINQSDLRYFGVLCRRTEELERKVAGVMDRRQPHGRSPNRWVDQMWIMIGHSQPEANTAAHDRNPWRETHYKQLLHDVNLVLWSNRNKKFVMNLDRKFNFLCHYLWIYICILFNTFFIYSKTSKK